MCNGHEKSNWQVGAVGEPLPLLHTSGSPGCREGWWHTAAWGWIYLTPLPQEISGERLFLNRWEPSGFGAMKTCSKWQLLGEMAVRESGREVCWNRTVKSCSVSVPSSNQETLKLHIWRCVNIHKHKCFMLEPFVSDPVFQLACYNAERRVHGRWWPASLKSKWGLFVTSCLLSINLVSENRYSRPTQWCICLIHSNSTQYFPW